MDKINLPRRYSMPKQLSIRRENWGQIPIKSQIGIKSASSPISTSAISYKFNSGEEAPQRRFHRKRLIRDQSIGVTGKLESDSN